MGESFVGGRPQKIIVFFFPKFTRNGGLFLPLLWGCLVPQEDKERTAPPAAQLWPELKQQLLKTERLIEIQACFRTGRVLLYEDLFLTTQEKLILQLAQELWDQRNQQSTALCAEHSFPLHSDSSIWTGWDLTFAGYCMLLLHLRTHTCTHACSYILSSMHILINMDTLTHMHTNMPYNA